MTAAWGDEGQQDNEVGERDYSREERKEADHRKHEKPPPASIIPSTPNLLERPGSRERKNWTLTGQQAHQLPPSVWTQLA